MSYSWYKNFLSRKKNGLVFLLTGLFFLTVAFSLKEYQRWRENRLSFSHAPEPLIKVEEEDLPVRILISKVGIDLPVVLSKAIENNWEVSQEGASYLAGSGIPGQEGNAVIYGHNKNNLFGPIRWLEKEDKIKVINKRGEEFIYKVVETKTVSPETIEVLLPTQDATLTLYTCIGFLDRERFVVVAKLEPE